MTFLQRLALTFLDKDGSIAMPEVIATLAAFSCIAAPLYDWVHRGVSFPIDVVGTRLMELVVGLAVAQRVRDGLWKPDHDGGDR